MLYKFAWKLELRLRPKTSPHYIREPWATVVKPMPFAPERNMEIFELWRNNGTSHTIHDIKWFDRQKMFLVVFRHPLEDISVSAGQLLTILREGTGLPWTADGGGPHGLDPILPEPLPIPQQQS